MFLGRLQVLLYARPLNAQHLFSKPGKRPLLRILLSLWGLSALLNEFWFYATS